MQLQLSRYVPIYKSGEHGAVIMQDLQFALLHAATSAVDTMKFFFNIPGMHERRGAKNLKFAVVMLVNTQAGRVRKELLSPVLQRVLWNLKRCWKLRLYTGYRTNRRGTESADHGVHGYSGCIIERRL